MRVSVSDAKGKLTELVRRAEAGDEIILTRHGYAAVRLVPVQPGPDRSARRALLDAVRAAGAAKAAAGPNAARSQDVLYDDDGLPGGPASMARRAPRPATMSAAPDREPGGMIGRPAVADQYDEQLEA